MGLDTTHGAYNGAYSSFNDFRRALLKAYNGEDLFDYVGYEYRSKRDNKRNSPGKSLINIDDDGLLLLMDHSDCEGMIRWVDCKLVADSIRKIATKLPSNYMYMAIQFANGCQLAYTKKEDLLFQ